MSSALSQFERLEHLLSRDGFTRAAAESWKVFLELYPYKEIKVRMPYSYFDMFIKDKFTIFHFLSGTHII